MSESWMSIATDPNHIIAELIWTFAQDVVLIWFIYGIIWKKVMLPKIHKKFDEQHGLIHKGEQK